MNRKWGFNFNDFSVNYNMTKINKEIEILTFENREIILTAVYKQLAVNTNNFLLEFENTCVVNLDVNKNVYILGNFNTDIVSNSSDAKELSNLVHLHEIKNVIKEGTRITRDSNKLIDLCIINNFNNKSGVIKKNNLVAVYLYILSIV